MIRAKRAHVRHSSFLHPLDGVSESQSMAVSRISYDYPVYEGAEEQQQLVLNDIFCGYFHLNTVR